jgi:uncharacterized protein
MKHLLKYFIISFIAMIPAFGQEKVDTAKAAIHVIAKVTDKSIVLRWAPDQSKAWKQSNSYGYKIVRYTYYRKKKKLTVPEVKEFTHQPFKPLALKDWESLAENNDYAAVAAEAIYGDSMDIQVDSKNFSGLIDQSKNFEYKYSFALFSADQSFPVAEAMGLAFTDTEFSKDEIYVYKVISNVPKNIAMIDTGSVVVRGGEKSLLPPIDKVLPEFGDMKATINWNVKYLTKFYTSYIIERSDDGGKTYDSRTKVPFINAKNEGISTDWNTFLDSLPKNGYTYYYRIKGKSPFGDFGPVSKTFSGMGLVEITNPSDLKITVINNQQVMIKWTYPDSLNKMTKGFMIKSTTNPSGRYTQINKLMIGPDKREFLYLTPKSYNYIIVSAIRITDEKEYSTLPASAQLLDTIPPLPPNGLKGKIDATGNVFLSWNKNKEDDVFGYRVYYANSPNDEFSQITKTAEKADSFAWKIPLNNLSNKIYFKILAIDSHFNPSKFSSITELVKPDTIAPTCPVFKQVLSSDTAVYIEFYPSSSLDVKAHTIYRRCNDSTKWVILASLQFSAGRFWWSDKTAQPGTTYEYSATAMDESGNESRFSPKFKTQRINSGRKEEIPIQGKADRSDKTITISWKKPKYPVNTIYIYRAIGNEKGKFYQTLKNTETSFMDKKLTVNTLYKYKLSVEYTDGTVNYSNEIEVKY